MLLAGRVRISSLTPKSNVEQKGDQYLVKELKTVSYCKEDLFCNEMTHIVSDLFNDLVIFGI